MPETAENSLVDLQQTLYQSKNPSRRWLHTVRRDWVMARIQKYGNPDRRGTALEVGPGAGVYIPCLSGAADRVVVSDRETAYLAHAAKLARFHNLGLVQDDITQTRLPANSADLILCTEVIEHIENSKVALSNLFKVLKPGGTLILTTPQKYSPLEVLSKIAYLPVVIGLVRRIYKEPVLKAGHVNLMTEKTLKAQIRTAGFMILETHKTGLYLPVLAEFTGEWGLGLARRLEKKIRGSLLDSLLWTQYYILTKPISRDRLGLEV